MSTAYLHGVLEQARRHTGLPVPGALATFGASHLSTLPVPSRAAGAIQRLQQHGAPPGVPAVSGSDPGAGGATAAADGASHDASMGGPGGAMAGAMPARFAGPADGTIADQANPAPVAGPSAPAPRPLDASVPAAGHAVAATAPIAAVPNPGLAAGTPQREALPAGAAGGRSAAGAQRPERTPPQAGADAPGWARDAPQRRTGGALPVVPGATSRVEGSGGSAAGPAPAAASAGTIAADALPHAHPAQPLEQGWLDQAGLPGTRVTPGDTVPRPLAPAEQASSHHPARRSGHAPTGATAPGAAAAGPLAGLRRSDETRSAAGGASGSTAGGTEAHPNVPPALQPVALPRTAQSFTVTPVASAGVATASVARAGADFGSDPDSSADGNARRGTGNVTGAGAARGHRSDAPVPGRALALPAIASGGRLPDGARRADVGFALDARRPVDAAPAWGSAMPGPRGSATACDALNDNAATASTPAPVRGVAVSTPRVGPAARQATARLSAPVRPLSAAPLPPVQIGLVEVAVLIDAPAAPAAAPAAAIPADFASRHYLGAW